MLDSSQTIDWSSYSMTERRFQSDEALLPPTPSIVEDIKGKREEKVSTRNLQLFTPELKMSTPSLRLGVGVMTPVRSGAPSAISRRFQRLKNEGPDSQSQTNSPRLKPKSTFGEMSRIGGESCLEHNNTTTRSTGSIGAFTPDLCSTATVDQTFSELANSAKLDTTQSKIEMYKRALEPLTLVLRGQTLPPDLWSHRHQHQQGWMRPSYNYLMLQSSHQVHLESPVL